MKVAIYGLGILASIWVGFATGVVFLLTFALYWHNFSFFLGEISIAMWITFGLGAILGFMIIGFISS